ncbi:hypothetical protein HYDPIDRAFT_171697, partial [Hydnomerulius pinastri MD-312]
MPEVVLSCLWMSDSCALRINEGHPDWPRLKRFFKSIFITFTRRKGKKNINNLAPHAGWVELSRSAEPCPLSESKATSVRKSPNVLFSGTLPKLGALTLTTGTMDGDFIQDEPPSNFDDAYMELQAMHYFNSLRVQAHVHSGYYSDDVYMPPVPGNEVESVSSELSDDIVVDPESPQSQSQVAEPETWDMAPDLVMDSDHHHVPPPYNDIVQHPSTTREFVGRLINAGATSWAFVTMDASNHLWAHIASQACGRTLTENAINEAFEAALYRRLKVDPEWVPED